VTSREKGEHQNAARAALVIDTLSEASEQGLRLTDVTERTGLGPAVVHRLLAGLTAYGFVDHNKSSNRYFVGLKMVAWTAAAMNRYGLAPFVDGELTRLCEMTEDTVYFSLPSGLDSVCVDRREGTYPIKTLTLSIGDRRPLGIGAGSLALLAFQPNGEMSRILEVDEERRDPFGISAEALAEMIAQSRERGFCLNEGHLIPGMSGVGVPIKDGKGQAVAAISIAAVTTRLSGERLDMVVAALRDAAAAIERSAAEILQSPLARRQSVRKA